MTGLSRAFREHIAFKSFVSARFIGHAVITQSTLLETIVNKSRKLTKFELEEVIVDLKYVSALEKAFMINPATASEETEEAKINREIGG